MKIIGYGKLEEFWKRDSGTRKAKESLETWYTSAENSLWSNIIEVKNTCGRHTDGGVKGKCTVFDIGGNKFRLITTINYQAKIVMIEKVMSHKEYDNWCK